MAERRIMAQIRHPFVAPLIFAFQSSEKLYMVTEYCPGGELFFHLSRFRRFPEHVARFYAAELALAIGFLHSRSIIYRDMKPENVRGSAPLTRARPTADRYPRARLFA